MDTTNATEQQEQERLVAELALLQAHRSDLLRQLEEVDLRVEQNAIEMAKFAPVNIDKIPDDVLKLILEDAYQHHNPPDPFADTPCKMPTALTATQVCRRWRRVAASLPTLWQCVHVNLHEEAIALHVSRSVDLPLHLGGRFTSESTTLFVDLLLKSAHRCKSVSLWSSEVLSSFRLANALDKIEFKCLEFISIIDPSASLVESTMKLAAVSPNLQTLVLHGNIDIQNFSPLPNLRTLYIMTRYDITCEQLAQLSAAAPRLNDLTIGFDSPISDGTVISFPNLQTIRFAGVDWDELFGVMDAPQLRSFISFAGPFWTQYSVDIGGQNPPRTYPHMTHMLLHSGMADSREAAHYPRGFGLFRQAPNLTCLEIIGCGAMSQVLKWLRDTTANQDDILLPKLETVSLTDVNDSDLSTVVEFVQRRSHFQPPLRELKLGAETIEAMGSDVVQMLSQLVKVSTVSDSEI